MLRMLLQITVQHPFLAPLCDRTALWVAASHKHSGCPVFASPLICTHAAKCLTSFTHRASVCEIVHPSLPLTVACLRWGWAQHCSLAAASLLMDILEALGWLPHSESGRLEHRQHFIQMTITGVLSCKPFQLNYFSEQ